MVAAARKPKAAKSRPKRQPGWLNQAEMAASWGVSRKTLQEWGVEPVARIGRNVYYTAADVHRARVDRMTAALQARDDVPDAEIDRARAVAELRLTEERAENQRLKNAQLRKELAPVEMLTWALSDVASQVVPLLTTIPADMKRRVPKLTNSEVHAMREIIANALNLVAEVRLDLDGYDPDGEQDPTA